MLHTQLEFAFMMGQVKYFATDEFSSILRIDKKFLASCLFLYLLTYFHFLCKRHICNKAISK